MSDTLPAKSATSEAYARVQERWLEAVRECLDGVDLANVRVLPTTPKRMAAEIEADRVESRRSLVTFHANKRRAAKLQRTPAWANLDAMRAIYADAQRLTAETGIPHHVDHVIPLQGRLVSGLHVHNNLQILTGSENSRKRNSFKVEE